MRVFRTEPLKKDYEIADDVIDGDIDSIVNGKIPFDHFIAGDYGAGNYTEIETDGSIGRYGDATTWDDLVGGLIGSRLNSTAGKVDYNYDENTITFQKGGSITNINDCIVSSFQYPHKAKVGTGATLNFHMHWEQPDSLDYEFTFRYRIQNNGSAKNTTWTDVVVSTNTNDIYSYTSGTMNQITKLVDIDMSGANISSTIQWRLARTDTQTPDIEVTFLDAHYETTTDGSRTEYTK